MTALRLVHFAIADTARVWATPPADGGGGSMTLRFGVFDPIEPVPGLRLDRIYRERLVQIKRPRPAGGGGAPMTLRCGASDHMEPVPVLRLDRIYRERLLQIERLDTAGF